MTTLTIVEDNSSFTCGILSHENGRFRPFFQDHTIDDFEESEVCECEDEAYIALVLVIIGKLDEAFSFDEDLEGEEDVDISHIGNSSSLSSL